MKKYRMSSNIHSFPRPWRVAGCSAIAAIGTLQSTQRSATLDFNRLLAGQPDASSIKFTNDLPANFNEFSDDLRMLVGDIGFLARVVLKVGEE